MKSHIIVFISTVHLLLSLHLAIAQSNNMQPVPKGMAEQILSKDYTIAQKALLENQQKGNTQAVCLSLKNQMLGIKSQAVSALKVMKDSSAVECLIAALKDNQVPQPGGTEERILQDDLDENIILTLHDLVGIQIPQQDKKSQAQSVSIKKPAFTREQVKKVIKDGEEWLVKKQSTNKNKKR